MVSDGNLEGQRYSAFISYNHRDRRWASWLHRRLERYVIPKNLRGRTTPLGTLGVRLPPVFQDREELAASTDLAQSVKIALAESATLIVICSPHAARSRWVNEEIREFIRLGRQHRIQLLVVGGTAGHPNDIASGSDACFPPALFENGSAEPLAADLRVEADGKRGALLKLIAGILALGYDELRRRDHARRQRQLITVAATLLIGFIAMTALATFALLSRREAVVQRDIARKRTITAERTAEFVQSLFEVSDPSEAKGEKVTAKEMLDKGARRISTTLSNEPEVKAQLMTTLGQVYLALGSYRKGDEIIRRSLTLDASDPSVRARQLMALGDSQNRQGEYTQAVETLGRALAIAKTAEGANPQLVAQALIARGEARSALEDHAGAEADIRRALKLDIVRAGPRNTAVARGLEALGFDLMTSDRLSEARNVFERALAIRIPTQGLAHPRVSEDLSQLGSIAYLQRDSAAAERYWLRALRSDVIVLGPDHPDISVTLNNVARVQLERRAYASARALLERSAKISLAEQNETHDDLAFTFANLGMAERGLGNNARAEALLQKAWRAADLHKHRNRAPILVELADLSCARGDIDEGRSLLDRAVPIMAADYSNDAWRAAWVENTRGSCLVYARQYKAGRAMILASMPAIRARWRSDTLFGSMAERRLRRAESMARE